MTPDVPRSASAHATPGPHTAGVAHAMLFNQGMKPLLILLILALGPALGEMTAPVPPAPLVTMSSVTDVQQVPNA